MKSIRLYISKHKQQLLIFGITVVLFTAFLFGVAHDYNFYPSSIAKVNCVSERYLKSEKGPNGEVEKYYVQQITLTIKNGAEKGRTAESENTYSSSCVNSEKYQVGDKLFVTIKSDSGKLTAEINGVKRDAYVAFVAGLFFIGMVFISGKQGLLTIVSFCVNIAVFVFSIILYLDGKNFIELCLLMIFIFTVTTLFLTGGFSQKTLGALISTFITLSLTFLIYKCVITFIEKPPYHLMDYIFVPRDLDSIFLAGILIGCLGAVMDVAVTVHSAVNELLRTSKNITKKDLIHSIREIAYDVMGTMINVLLFSYISGSLPMIVLKVLNGYSLYSLVRFNIIFELIRFLVGSIGIVVAIPISGVVSVLIEGRGRTKC
jgi:Predicted multitransmembrane protein